jgi:hypothetical protein
LQRDVRGRVHRCSLSPDAMHNAAAWIDKQRAFWNATLDRLDDLLAEEPPRAERPQRKKTT